MEVMLATILVVWSSLLLKPSLHCRGQNVSSTLSLNCHASACSGYSHSVSTHSRHLFDESWYEYLSEVYGSMNRIDVTSHQANPALFNIIYTRAKVNIVTQNSMIPERGEYNGPLGSKFYRSFQYATENFPFRGDHEWVEVMRAGTYCLSKYYHTPHYDEGLSTGFYLFKGKKLVPFGCWFYATRGTGVFVNIGKTLVAGTRRELQERWGLVDTDTDMCTRARSEGYDSIQMLHDFIISTSHRKCGQDVQVPHQTIGADGKKVISYMSKPNPCKVMPELVICNGGCATVGYNTTCPPVSLQTGVRATKPCLCDDGMPILNCGAKFNISTANACPGPGELEASAPNPDVRFKSCRLVKASAPPLNFSGNASITVQLRFGRFDSTRMNNAATSNDLWVNFLSTSQLPEMSKKLGRPSLVQVQPATAVSDALSVNVAATVVTLQHGVVVGVISVDHYGSLEAHHDAAEHDQQRTVLVRRVKDEALCLRKRVHLVLLAVATVEMQVAKHVTHYIDLTVGLCVLHGHRSPQQPSQAHVQCRLQKELQMFIACASCPDQHRQHQHHNNNASADSVGHYSRDIAPVQQQLEVKFSAEHDIHFHRVAWQQPDVVRS